MVPLLALARQQTAHQHMLALDTLPHPYYPSSSLTYPSLSRGLQTYLCILKGLTDLVFDPPSPISLSKSTLPSTSSQSTLPSPTSLPGYPETTFLDSARLVVLGTEAADASAMYMFLMLLSSSIPTLSKVTESDLLLLKTKIRDIASCHLGYCYIRPSAEKESSVEGSETEKAEDKEWEKWQKAAQDVVLQIATAKPEESKPEPVDAAKATAREHRRSILSQKISLTSSGITKYVVRVIVVHRASLTY
jgi:hypothetical protein